MMTTAPPTALACREYVPPVVESDRRFAAARYRLIVWDTLDQAAPWPSPVWYHLPPVRIQMSAVGCCFGQRLVGILRKLIRPNSLSNTQEPPEPPLVLHGGPDDDNSFIGGTFDFKVNEP